MVIRLFLLFLAYSTLTLGATESPVEEEVKEAAAALTKIVTLVFLEQEQKKEVDGYITKDGEFVHENGSKIQELSGRNILFKEGEGFNKKEEGQLIVISVPALSAQELGSARRAITAKTSVVKVEDMERSPPLLLKSWWQVAFSMGETTLDPIPLRPSSSVCLKNDARYFIGVILKNIGPEVDLSLTLEGNNVRLQGLEPFYAHKHVATYIADRISPEYQPSSSMKEKEWKAVVDGIAENDQGALRVLYQPGFIKEAFSFAVKNNYWGPFALLMPIIASIRVSLSAEDSLFIGFAQRIVLESHKTAYPKKSRWQKLREWVAQQAKGKKNPVSTYRREGGFTTVNNPAFVHPKKADDAVPPAPPPVRGSPRRASISGTGGAGAVAPQTPPVRRPLPSTLRPTAPPEEDAAATKKETPPSSPAVSAKRSSRSMLPNDEAVQQGKSGEALPGSIEERSV